MEALPARDPVSRVSLLALLRQPLAWAALAAFVGSAVGLAETLHSLLAVWVGPSGGLLAALSFLGVAWLLGRTSWAARIGSALLLLWLAATVSFLLYFSLWLPAPGSSGIVPRLGFWVLLHASLWGGPAAALPFALGALFGVRKWLLGAVLLALSVPGTFLVSVYVNSTGAYVSLREVAALVGAVSSPGASVGVPEAILWVSLGILLLSEARERAASKLREDTARKNKEKARRFYEEGLGKGDLSAVDEVVSEHFRDLKSGARGRLGMERVIGDLWASYPDLSVSVEGQEAEGDVVRTRLAISGTDRGGGVMWYPPTGRNVSFGAEFADRFSGGMVVEHAGEADTEGLLRQLGHHVEHRPGNE